MTKLAGHLLTTVLLLNVIGLYGTNSMFEMDCCTENGSSMMEASYFSQIESFERFKRIE